MSPMIVTVSPSKRPFSCFTVKQSSSAWVGCSCAPSPALMTGDRERVGDALGYARHLVAHDHGVGIHRVERHRGVEDALGLREARRRRREVHDIRREPLACDLEAGTRAGRRLEEEIDQRAPAQRRHLLDVPAPDFLHALGGFENPLEIRAVEVLDAEQVTPRHAPPPFASGITTSSGPSSEPARPRSSTRSPRCVGTFLPTKSILIGSSR